MPPDNYDPELDSLPPKGDRASRALVAVLSGAIAATVLLVALYLIWFRGKLSNRPEDWGLAGDYIGGVGGMILSAATLVAVFLTVALQREILLVTRQQLADTRRELALTREESTRSAEALTRQTFENTFFRMLEQFRAEARSVNHNGHVGPAAFRDVRDILVMRYREQIPDSQVPSKSVLAELFGVPFNSGRAWLGPYFRTLHQILRFVDHTTFDKDRERDHQIKDRYASLVCSKLDGAELALLYFHCLTPAGERLYPYIVRYGLLQHLDPEHDLVAMVGLQESFGRLYFPAAFEGYKDRLFWLFANDQTANPIED